jgi:hypothetical protein
MRKYLILTILCLWMAHPVLAKDDPLQARLSAEFQGHSFATKVLLGSYVTVRHPRTGQQMARLIDTEFSPDGSLRYLVRHGYWNSSGEPYDVLTPSFYIDAAQMTGTVSPGTGVTVTKVVLKDDRIELLLSTSPDGTTVQSYAKLKYMLPKGYRGWEYDVVAEVIARALSVDRFEKLYVLNADYNRLKNELPTAETDYKHLENSNPSDRLTAATHLHQVLQDLASNRIEFAGLGHPENESAQLQGRAKALEPEIKSLEETVHKQRTAELETKAASDLAEAGRTRAELQRIKVSSQTDWQKKSDLLTREESLLRDVQTDYEQLAAAGAPASAPELKELQQELQDVQVMRTALEEDRGRVGALELENQYRSMERRRVELQAEYMKAFGSSKEHATLETLAAHLRQMYQNRLAAQQAGSKTAANQAAQLLNALNKLQ